VEVDAYDRAAFANLCADSAALQALLASGGKLLPHFDGFVLDLYALCYKLNIVLHPPEAVTPGATFFRVLIDELRGAAALEILRQQTVLDERVAGLAALLLGESMLELLKSERALTRAEMLDLWNLEQQAEEIAERGEHAETAAELAAEREGQSGGKQLGELRQRLERENAAAMRHLEQQSRRVAQALADSASRRQPRVTAQLERTVADLETARDEAEQWSTQFGGGHQSSPAAQLALGHQLARNPKLKRMAQLVGRMRESARALRRTLYERASNSVLRRPGRRPEPLLPPELLSLRHPLLRRDFRRRLLDGELLVYELRAREQRGRGPMIVCLDGSSSMAGDRDLVEGGDPDLLDIAARQRRRFRSICFSSAETPLQVLELNARQRSAPELSQVFALAEYFPAAAPTSRSRSTRPWSACAPTAAAAATSCSSPTASAASSPSGCAPSSARRRLGFASSPSSSTRPQLARRRQRLQRPRHLGAPAHRRRHPRHLPEGKTTDPRILDSCHRE
jgi:hypothetical protein